MSFINRDIKFNELIQFTKEGIFVANYNQIRTAITERFKEIYGQDIDLSTASADGIYVEMLCLMMSNMLQSFKQFYSQLDVRTASGSFLDALCALSNVYRKAETHSTCSVVLTLDENATQPHVTNEIQLADVNGNIWIYSNQNSITFEAGVRQTIIVTAENPGPVRADPGWIDRLINNDVVMNISQTTEAEIGSYSESDTELRARRNSSLGATGNTVLETMIGTLFTLNGIDDVKIYNNDSTGNITSLDGTSISQHDIYVVLRQQTNIEIADSLICSIIYEKLTPGIRTTNPGTPAKYGVQHEFTYLQSSTGTPIESEVVQNVYWKVATPITPKITIVLKVTTNYSSANNSTSLKIAQNVINYLNELRLSSTVYINDIWNVVTYSDPLFRGQATFRITSITIDRTDDAITDDNDENAFTLPDTYFGYTIENINIDDPNNDNPPTGDLSIVTITIGG